MLEKIANLVDNEARIEEARPLIVREPRTQSGQSILEAIDEFLKSHVASLTWNRRQLLDRYRLPDVARKVVGIGNVGTRCWITLLGGAHDRDPLFLQIKEAQSSVLSPYVGTKLPHANEGRRVLIGQRIIQGAPDIFRGWAEHGGLHNHVRQLRDMKGGLEFVPGETDLSNFVEYCGLCGWALALAHAKSGDAAMIAGYCGKSDELDQAVAKFSLAYADQTERDHEMLAKAVKRGELPVALQFRSHVSGTHHILRNHLRTSRAGALAGRGAWGSSRLSRRHAKRRSRSPR